MQVVLVCNHLDQVYGHHDSQDHTCNRHHDGVGQILNHIENTAIPSLWGLSYLYGYIRDLLVYAVKHPRKVAHNTAHQHFFQPICQGFK